jgi:hypothetical protein
MYLNARRSQHLFLVLRRFSVIASDRLPDRDALDNGHSAGQTALRDAA